MILSILASSLLILRFVKTKPFFLISEIHSTDDTSETLFSFVLIRNEIRTLGVSDRLRCATELPDVYQHLKSVFLQVQQVFS